MKHNLIPRRRSFFFNISIFPDFSCPSTSKDGVFRSYTEKTAERLDPFLSGTATKLKHICYFICLFILQVYSPRYTHNPFHSRKIINLDALTSSTSRTPFPTTPSWKTRPLEVPKWTYTVIMDTHQCYFLHRGLSGASFSPLFRCGNMRRV